MTSSQTTTRPARRRERPEAPPLREESPPPGPAPSPHDPGGGFWYELSEAALRIGVGELLVRIVPYWRIERVERGWAPGLQLGAPGMGERGDEVRIRSSEPLGFPWLSLTPADPDQFVRRLSERLERALGATPPAPFGGPDGLAVDQLVKAS